MQERAGGHGPIYLLLPRYSNRWTKPDSVDPMESSPDLTSTFATPRNVWPAQLTLLTCSLDCRRHIDPLARSFHEGSSVALLFAFLLRTMASSKSWPRATAASWSDSGTKCEYTLSVVLGFRWPSRPATVRTSTPAVKSRVAT